MEITVVEQDNTILLNQHSTIPLLTICVEGLWICLMIFMISPESHGSRGKLWELLILTAYFRKTEEVCHVNGRHPRDQHTNTNMFTALCNLTYHTFSPFITAKVTPLNLSTHMINPWNFEILSSNLFKVSCWQAAIFYFFENFTVVLHEAVSKYFTISMGWCTQHTHRAHHKCMFNFFHK